MMRQNLDLPACLLSFDYAINLSTDMGMKSMHTRVLGSWCEFYLK